MGRWFERLCWTEWLLPHVVLISPLYRRTIFPVFLFFLKTKYGKREIFPKSGNLSEGKKSGKNVIDNSIPLLGKNNRKNQGKNKTGSLVLGKSESLGQILFDNNDP